jgi:HPt (histidine-containing phosphotransfer) domain-containing protein/HAMP domain-containing protein
VVVPFLLIYTILSATMIYQTYQAQDIKLHRELLNIARYYESNLKNFYDFAELSVRISATELEALDGGDQDARRRGEAILTSRFDNAHVINTWLVFEPNAFDGRDALHTGDYPGAPSGRYIRSFNRRGNSWEVAADIDETTLNDRDRAYWYIAPRNSGSIYTDLGLYTPLWDYGNGTPLSSIGVSAPVFRDNTFIGCVGLDFEMNENILGEQFFLDVKRTIFLTDGRLGYSVDTGNMGKTLEDLGFNNSPQIREAMREGRKFLYNGYSELFRIRGLNYFYPMQVKDRFLYIYIVLSQDYIWENMIPVLKPMGISILISLVMVLLLLQYLSRGIAKPIQKLTRTSEAIAAGDLDIRIEYEHAGGELNMITRALSRMVDQFRTSKLLQRRYQNRFDIIIAVHYALFRSKSLGAAFNAALTAVAEYFHVFKASLIFTIEEVPRIAALYPSAEGPEERSEFFSHRQVVNLLGNKKHLTMNYGALRSMQLPFVDFNTRSLCILPLRVDQHLKGYIIMEGNEPDPFVHDDTTLFFISDTLACLLSSQANWMAEPGGGEEAPGNVLEEPVFVQPENTDAFLERAKDIKNLNVDQGLLLIGGEKEKYTELLRVTINVIGEGIRKMRALYADDSAGFGIEIHGMKGALYSIGAELLGDEARKLEFAAKSEDTVYCREQYPAFEEKLRILSRNLASLFPKREGSSQPGSPAELGAVLKKIQTACANFDNAGAQSLLARVNDLKWEDRRISEILHHIGTDVENLEYDGAAEKIKEALEYLENGG